MADTNKKEFHSGMLRSEDTRTFGNDVPMDETFAAEIENAPERYLRFPSKHEIHQYRIMEDFIDQFSPGKAQEELLIKDGVEVVDGKVDLEKYGMF